ncbi:MAG TPA: ArsA-related P-loop ATPase [Acidimicrobiia bacterium]
MELERFCSTSRVVIVAGKGGVGKTTVTAAFATAAARAGTSVLIVEVEGKSGLASAFGQPGLTYEEAELAPGVTARTLTPDEALIEYLEAHGLRRISKRLVRSGALDVVATAVPGMKDILVLGKVKALDVENRFDLILVDAPAAGHAITFLTSPRGLVDAVKVGPINAQAADVIKLLSDPARCQVMLVTIPEETPVNELVETGFALEDRVGIKLGPVVINGCTPPVPGLDDGPPTRDQIERDAATADVFVSSREAADLAGAAGFRAQRRAVQQEQAERLAARLPLPQIRLPFLYSSAIGPAELATLADELTTEIEALPEPAPT